MHVIAKAYGDEPLSRILTGVRGKIAYVLNPSPGNASGIAAFSGVGFPADCVFSYDQPLFDSLQGAWVAQDRARLEQLWRSATPLREADKIAA